MMRSARASSMLVRVRLVEWRRKERSKDFVVLPKKNKKYEQKK